MSTQESYRTIVTVAGRSLGEFETRSGGKVTGEPTKRRSGGGRTLKSYGVLPDFDDVTVTRVYEKERDHVQAGWLRSVAGKVPASVSEFPLDVDGNVIGDPVTYVGMFMSIDDGETDVTSADTRMLELGFQITSVTNPKR